MFSEAFEISHTTTEPARSQAAGFIAQIQSLCLQGRIVTDPALAVVKDK